MAKANAEKVWMRLKPDAETAEKIMAGLKRDVKGEWNGREREFIPHPSTWLNQKRWDNGEEGEAQTSAYGAPSRNGGKWDGVDY